MIERVLSDADIAAIISESDAVEGAHMLPYSFARTVEKAVLAKLAEKQGQADEAAVQAVMTRAEAYQVHATSANLERLKLAVRKLAGGSL
ncbi:MAG: hypothetical protein KA173_02620 [Rhodoferax sp.]|nr:hypothetical protein [Rhodoferax sp.]